MKRFVSTLPGLRDVIDTTVDKGCYDVETLYWVRVPSTFTWILNSLQHSGLAWHTDDNALRTKFEEFGAVEEAVRSCVMLSVAILTGSLTVDSRQRPRYWSKPWLWVRPIRLGTGC